VRPRAAARGARFARAAKIGHANRDSGDEQSTDDFGAVPEEAALAVLGNRDHDRVACRWRLRQEQFHRDRDVRILRIANQQCLDAVAVHP